MILGVCHQHSFSLFSTKLYCYYSLDGRQECKYIRTLECVAHLLLLGRISNLMRSSDLISIHSCLQFCQQFLWIQCPPLKWIKGSLAFYSSLKLQTQWIFILFLSILFIWHDILCLSREGEWFQHKLWYKYVSESCSADALCVDVVVSLQIEIEKTLIHVLPAYSLLFIITSLYLLPLLLK